MQQNDEIAKNLKQILIYLKHIAKKMGVDEKELSHEL